jgi:hypothetical protein
MIIDLASVFSPYPSGRFEDDSAFNGERFRNQILEPALSEAMAHGDKVIVNIDGVRSFGSSFLEEAFAGLVRLRKFGRKDILDILEIRCTKPHLKFYKENIDRMLRAALPETAV